MHNMCLSISDKHDKGDNRIKKSISSAWLWCEICHLNVTICVPM